MKFGWINLFGAVITALLLIPNIVFALRNKNAKNLCSSKIMNAVGQLGRYACVVLMWLPLSVGKFAFPSVFDMLLYLAGNAALIAAYWLVFAAYMKRKSAPRALMLAVLPSCVFLMSGVLLRHWLLAGSAILFAVGHIYVTLKNTGDPA